MQHSDNTRRYSTNPLSEEKIQEDCHVCTTTERSGDERKEVQEECHVCTTTERLGDERKEAEVRSSEILNKAWLPQNINVIGRSEPPIAHVHPSFPPFLNTSLQNPGIHVRLNLPKLVIPEILLQFEEIAIRNLYALLRHNNFIVQDRPSLAFFALGAELDVRAAAQFFVNFVSLANTEEFKSPSRERMEAIEADGFIEGFAWHKDGTFGPLVNLQKWNIRNHTAAYIVREGLCYVFNMVDLARLRRGITAVFNAQNFNWRAFAPFEKAKTIAMWRSVMPLQMRKRLYIDPGCYFLIANSVMRPLLPDIVNKKTVMLLLNEVRHTYPLVVLSRSLTGMTNNKYIMRLSADKQLYFRFFLNGGTIN